VEATLIKVTHISRVNNSNHTESGENMSFSKP